MEDPVTGVYEGNQHASIPKLWREVDLGSAKGHELAFCQLNYIKPSPVQTPAFSYLHGQVQHQHFTTCMGKFNYQIASRHESNSRFESPQQTHVVKFAVSEVCSMSYFGLVKYI